MEVMKTRKKMKKMVMAVCFIGVCFIGGQAIAGNGYGKGNGNGNGGSTGMYVDICSADITTVAGTISEADLYSGQGIKIDNGDEVVTVYGIGPIRYWSNLDIARPIVGDDVIIDIREVTFSDGTIKNIAMSISFTDSGESVELRDENCLSNWRGGNNAGQMLNTSSLSNKTSLQLSGRGRGKGNASGSGRGPGDGTGNGGNGSKDGSGNGSRTGDCPYITT